jgi:hypothetical protein
MFARPAADILRVPMLRPVYVAPNAESAELIALSSLVKRPCSVFSSRTTPASSLI